MVSEATVTSSPRPSPRTTPTPWTASTCHPTAQTRRPARYPCVVSQRPAGLAVSRRDQQALLFPAETSRLCCFPQRPAGFVVSRLDQQALLFPAETSRLFCVPPQRPTGFAVSRRDQQALLCHAETNRLCCVPQRPAGFAVSRRDQQALLSTATILYLDEDTSKVLVHSLAGTSRHCC
jgi:hypothetical protein